MFSSIVPFSGFYGSSHAQRIDHCEEQLFQNDQGEVNDELYKLFVINFDYGSLYEKYAEYYVNILSRELQITLEFELLISPKEYNFTTDRVFAKISQSDLVKMLWKVKGKRLNQKIKEWFTTRPGFISSYPNDIKQWKRISEWDHNQIGCVLNCYMDYMQEKELLKSEENLVDEHIEDEDIMNWIYECANGKAERAINIFSYLRQRKERN